MKKVINITIGSIVFQIEDDAYEQLNNYLETIKKHFSEDEESKEILEDIEISIAEKFQKKQKSHNKNTQPINNTDVKKVISELGTIEDFQEIEKNEKSSKTQKDKKTENSEENKENQTDEDSKKTKKLYRDPNDVILGGVCSGIAAYFGQDTAIIRFTFLITFFTAGIGIIPYIILWIILPEAQTTAQKLEMKGEKVTLKKIETTLKEGVNKLKKKTPEKELAKFFEILKKITQVVVQTLRFVIGISLTIATILTIFFTTLAATTVIYSEKIIFTELLITNFIPLSGTLSTIFILAIYFTILIPLITILIASLSLIRWKNLFTTTSAVILIIFWTISLATSSTIIIDYIPEINEEIKELEQKTSLNSSIEVN